MVGSDRPLTTSIKALCCVKLQGLFFCTTSSVKMLEREDCTWHTPSYCEENVYRLCQHLMKVEGADESTATTEEEGEREFETSKLFAVFISNQKKAVPIWCQKASQRSDGLVLWDYHVILIKKEPVTSMVYDQDTFLDFPCTLDEYAKAALPPLALFLPPEERSEEDDEEDRLYRIVPASMFVREFASDRSHMKRKDGSWMAEPPVMQCIKTEESTMNLPVYWTMKIPQPAGEAQKFGRVLTEPEFLEFFGVLNHSLSEFQIISW
ncbi:N-terminal glutamine amidase-domain-containing protein [Chytridium lagenaria]|nr:N-terminal glutamine amidase-domain-containing protein [Chytridium lagenaria]